VTAPAATATPTHGRLWLPYALIASVFLAVKLVSFLTMNPIGDEAYYWLWGQHLDWSYFDHPPLHAWLLGLVDLVLGWNLWSLRALTWLTFGGTLLIFWDWAKRLQPEDPATYFWRATAIYLAAPLFLGMSTLVFHDHLMMFLVVASGHLMLVFAEGVETNRPRYRWLYLSAALLGLAVLTKYNAVFLGLGFAVFFIVRQPLRALYRNPHTYLAALLSIAIQAPMLWWNYANDFASYGFHFTGRWRNTPRFNWESPLLFLVVAAIVASPFVLYAVIRYCRRKPAEAFEARAQALAVSTFLLSSVCMLVLASFAEVLFYWNIVAFILMVPLLPLVMRNAWLFWSHMAYGVAMSVLLLVNQNYAPIGNLFGSYDWTIASTYGWDQIGAEVEAARAEHGADFVGTTFYTTASQLGFAIGDVNTVAISTRPDQFDVWFDPEAHRGQSAIIVADPYNPIDYAASFFARATPLKTVEVQSFGRQIYAPTLYLLEGFTPPAAGEWR
jgi:hypothetical protein